LCAFICSCQSPFWFNFIQIFNVFLFLLPSLFIILNIIFSVDLFPYVFWHLVLFNHPLSMFPYVFCLIGFHFQHSCSFCVTNDVVFRFKSDSNFCRCKVNWFIEGFPCKYLLVLSSYFFLLK
jgi:hypothetical protein